MELGDGRAVDERQRHVITMALARLDVPDVERHVGHDRSVGPVGGRAPSELLTGVVADVLPPKALISCVKALLSVEIAFDDKFEPLVLVRI